jgi:hypothetical protein
MSLFLAALLKPFALVAVLCAFASIVIAIQRWFPDGPFKRLLLFKVWD